MKSKHKISLKVTLTTAFLIFSALLLIILWVFQTMFLDEFYKTVKTSQVKSCVYSLADNIESDTRADLIADIENQNHMTVRIFNTTSEISVEYVSSSQGMAAPEEGLRQEAQVTYNKAKANGGELSTQGISLRLSEMSERMLSDDRESDDDPDDIDDNDDDRFIPGGRMDRNPMFDRQQVESLEYAKIVTAGESEYLLVISSEITPVSSVVETLRIQLIIVTAVMVVVSIAVAVITALRIAKPISRTNEQAKHLAHQDYSVRFSEGGYREVAELNDTLNFAAKELGKVDALRRELIANISHDLRTPLTMITGYSEVMRDLPGEVTPENIQIIIDEANHLNALVSDLLDISRLESGTAEMNIVPFSLTRCIEGIFDRYMRLIEAEGYDISFEHDGEVFVRGDELRITQVLYNLINNAVNYVDEDKTVIVRQTVKDGKVRIDVIDHGEGIPQEKLDYIWDRYYRVDKEHKQAKIGTGLGLSIVKNILRAHGAEFGVESEPGTGSDFYFVMDMIDTESSVKQ